jgi:hypothetical protein
MASRDQLQILIQRITALPDEMQTELLQSLVEMRAQDLGIYHLDDEERAPLAARQDLL